MYDLLRTLPTELKRKEGARVGNFHKSVKRGSKSESRYSVGALKMVARPGH